LEDKKQRLLVLMLVSLLAYLYLWIPLPIPDAVDEKIKLSIIFLGTGPIYIILHTLEYRMRKHLDLIKNTGILTSIHGILWILMEVSLKGLKPILIIGPIYVIVGLVLAGYAFIQVKNQ